MTRLALKAAAWIDQTNKAPWWLLEALHKAGLIDLGRWPRPRPGWRDTLTKGNP
jgi:hypothetical protein